MVPLAPVAAEHVLSWEDETRLRIVALHHALIGRRPGLWGDHPCRPGSVLLLREGAGQWDAFGAGHPEPAVGWLAEREGTFALLAPDAWEPAVRAALGPLERARIETRFRAPRSDPLPDRHRIATHRLTSGAAAAFAAAAPGWARGGWASFEDLVSLGAGFGVPRGDGFAALSWILEQGRHVDAIGVVVAPRFRRLGLGRAVAAALVDHILNERGRVPLWSLASENAASRALGRSLGFTSVVGETLLRWRRRP
jgi:GNAT superfamily N-acetyltransferase